MKATGIFWSAPKQVEVHDFEIPDPGPGEVLVENVRTLISPGTESMWLTNDGLHALLGTTFPFTPGYTICGRVVAKGPETDNYALGDAVLAGFDNHMRPLGSHATHSLTVVEQINRIPDNISFEQAAFFQLGHTAVHLIELAHVEPSDTVAVVGVGAIGSIAVQIARAAGVASVVAVDISEGRLDQAETFGADVLINPTSPGAIEEFVERTGGATRVIDLSGSTTGVNTAIAMASSRARIVLSTGHPGLMAIDHEGIFLKAVELVGGYVNAYIERTQDQIDEFLRLIETGEVTIDHAIPEPVAPQEAPEIYRRILDKDPTIGSPMFRWKD
ncbi:zinc-dependent alcohol dehydrogenase [Nocardia australiensis]|uniref:zinc-dependent alcohol dehydrogenase n=1 Tax=Nocardia australiensis TaxID=2887191 RepID=UPI001D153501|nr:zinc-binding alcohol dehydrogenase [Nocardia australiensis]